MSSLNVKRWLRALEIAKILFEEEGYHTRFLEEIEDLDLPEEDKERLREELEENFDYMIRRIYEERGDSE